MPYGQEIGVVLPADQTTPFQTYLQTSAMVERKKALEEEKQQRLADQKRQERLGAERYLDDAFDFNKVATGVMDQDQFLLNSQNALRDKAAQLMYNGGLSESELRSMMRNDLQDINNMSAVTKLTRSQIDNSLKPYIGSESLNVDQLAKRAYRNSFTDTDPNTGAVTQKRIGDIKAADIRQMILDDPEGFVNKDQAGQITHTDLKNILEKSRGTSKEEYVDQDVKLKDGRIQKRKTKLSATKLPGQEIYFDGDKPALRFKTESFVDDDKNEVKMLNNDSYNQYFSAPGAKAALMAEVNKRNPGKRIDFRTPAGEREMKKVALDLVNDNRISGTDVRYSNLEDMGALQRGYGSSSVTREEKKEQTAYDKAKQSAIYRTMQYIKGDATKHRVDPNTGLRKISEFLPGGKLMSERIESKGGNSSPQAFEGVYMDDKNNMYVKYGENDKPTLIKPNKRYDWLSGIAEANGVPLAQFDKMYQEMFPGSSPESDAAGYKIAYDDMVSDFEAKGGLKGVGKYMGDYYLLDEKNKKSKVQINEVRRKGNTYEMDYVTESGTKETKKGMTKEFLAALLKKHYD